MTEKLYVWFGITLVIVLIVWFVLWVAADWGSKRSVKILSLINKHAGTDKLWNIFLKNSEDVGTNTIIACQIGSRLENDKVQILIPKKVTDYRLGHEFEHDSYDIGIANIKRIMPYEPPEAYTHMRITGA